MKGNMKKAFMLCIAITMVLSVIPLVEGENEYTVLVMIENKIYKVGDEVTLKIYFYNKDTPVDADDVNVTIGYSSYPIRYIEVNEAEAKVETGVYHVTFTIEEDDVTWGVSGTVRCTKTESRADKSAEWGFQLFMEVPGTFDIDITVNKPRFQAGDTVRFDVVFTNNSEKVDPHYIDAVMYMNGKGEDVTLQQDSRGTGEYYYEYNAPGDSDSREVGLDVNAYYDEDGDWASSEARLDYYQVWLHTITVTETQYTGQIGVCDLTGTPVVADVTVDYDYENDTGADQYKQVTGQTNDDGLLDITLDYPDFTEGSEYSVHAEIWANGTGSRAGYNQWSRVDINPRAGQDQPDEEDFDVISQEDVFFLEKNEEVTIEYRAYQNGTPLANKEIYVFIFTNTWGLGLYWGYDGSWGEIYHVQKVTTDENGYFSITFTTPDKYTTLEVLFKADFAESRSGDTWEEDFDMLIIGTNFFFSDDMDIDIQNFGLGQTATITATLSGVNGGRGSVGVIPVDQSITEDEIQEMMFQELMEWERLNALGLEDDEEFSGDSFTRDIGVPGFFPDDSYFVVSARMWVEVQEGRGDFSDMMKFRAHLGYKIVDKNGNPISSEDRLKIALSVPSLLDSEEKIDLIAKITGSPAVENADITVEVTGSGSVDNASGKTDANGEFSFALEAKNVTNEDSSLTLYINASKSSYEDGHYSKTITVKAYVEPQIEVTEPQEVDFGENGTATVVAGIEGDVTITATAATQPDNEDPHAIGIYLEITKTGSGKLHWLNITIDYSDIPEGIEPEKLRIFYWDDVNLEWKRAENSGVDTSNKKVWANVTHLTIFAPRQAEGDITPPTIDHTPVTEGTAGEKIKISATITDDGDGVQNAELHYRKKGNTVYKKIDMTKDGDSYSTEIPSGDVYIEGVEYYIKATDGLNTRTHPTDINNPHSITITEKKDDDDDDDGFIPGFEIAMVMAAVLIGGILVVRKRR